MESNERHKTAEEAAFDELLEHLGEYTKEDHDVVSSNYLKLLRVLKTHKPVKIGDYQYGLSEKLQPNQRLIVFEWKDDRRKIREYSKRNERETSWGCRECLRDWRNNSTAAYSYLYVINGIIFIATEHNPICLPRNYELVKKYQKLLEGGKVEEAKSLTRKFNFAFNETYVSNIENSHAGPSASFFGAKVFSNNGNKSDMESKLQKRKSSFEEPSTSATGLGDRMVLEEKPENDIKKARITNAGDKGDVELLRSSPSEWRNESAKNFVFKKPSPGILKEVCSKLKIRCFSNEVEKLWERIVFNNIDTESNNIKTHELKTKNFFEILSLCFTGNSMQQGQLRITMNERFRVKIVTSGKLTSGEFNTLYLNNFTGKHLSFIAQYLQCRIMIVEDEMVKKFGKWKDTDEVLTLVFSYLNGFYSLILDF